MTSLPIKSIFHYPEIKNITNQLKFPPWQETFNNLDNLQTFIPKGKLCLKMIKIHFEAQSEISVYT